jgi:hypothetical protein
MFVEIEEMKSSIDGGVETASTTPIAGQGAEPTIVVAWATGRSSEFLGATAGALASAPGSTAAGS